MGFGGTGSGGTAVRGDGGLGGTAVAFDEELAERIKDVLGPRPGLSTKRMFGGLAFLLDGNLLCGVRNGLMLRVGPQAYPAALLHDGVGPFVSRGRAMTGWVLVRPEVLEETDALIEWLDQGIGFVATLPAGGTPKTRRRAPGPSKRHG